MGIVGEEFKTADIPIMDDVDFGHTDPEIILPLGCAVRLNPRVGEITLLVSPLSNAAQFGVAEKSLARSDKVPTTHFHVRLIMGI